MFLPVPPADEGSQGTSRSPFKPGNASADESDFEPVPDSRALRCPRCRSANVKSPKFKWSAAAELLSWLWFPLVLLLGWGGGLNSVSRYRCKQCGARWSRLNHRGMVVLAAFLIALLGLGFLLRMWLS